MTAFVYHSLPRLLRMMRMRRDRGRRSGADAAVLSSRFFHVWNLLLGIFCVSASWSECSWPLAGDWDKHTMQIKIKREIFRSTALQICDWSLERSGVLSAVRVWTGRRHFHGWCLFNTLSALLINTIWLTPQRCPAFWLVCCSDSCCYIVSRATARSQRLIRLILCAYLIFMKVVSSVGCLVRKCYSCYNVNQMRTDLL